MLVVRVLGERDLAPEIGREVRVRFRDLRANDLSATVSTQEKKRRIRTAAKVAFKKLPIVAVEPFDCV